MGKKRGPTGGGEVREDSPLAGPENRARSMQERVERYAKGKRVSMEVQRYLVRTDQLHRQAELLKKCAGTLLFHYYPARDDNRLVNVLTCKQHLLCGFCAIRRGSKYVEAYAARLRVVLADNPGLKASMVTLTVKNGSDLEERTNHIFAALKRLNNRRRMKKKGARSSSEWGKVLGLVGAYEVTEKGKAWHPHLHIFVLHKEDFDFSALRIEWKEITGDSHIFRIDAIKNIFDPIGEFCEIFKYSLKIAALSPEKRIHAYGILKGRRLVFSAGLFRGVEVPDSLLDDPLFGLEYIPYFYRYLDDAGAYTLVPKEQLTEQMNEFIKNSHLTKPTTKKPTTRRNQND